MSKLSLVDFDDFFSELWSTAETRRTPFQWQRDLAHRVLTSQHSPWPEAIALPTASGKTACLDIAVFALAAQADRIATDVPITAPRRIFFVVDRRVIVDEAYERAHKMAVLLYKAKDGVLGKVADNLRRIARGENDRFEGENPLSVHLLRGGMYRSEAWARDPLQPTIVASTVDQLGSRLLFRAYGRGSGMQPVYAGLIANDSLILLDEAHCAQPFLQTLQAVSRYRSWATTSLNRGFFPVVMSATPPAGLDKFEDTSGQGLDLEHPLGRRQMAHKPTTLEVVANARGAKATQQLAKSLAKTAEGLVDEQHRAIVVFVNRVATARAVFKELKANSGYSVTLLTGRMRPIDKDNIVKNQLKELASASSESRQLREMPHFVVATQTLEVGADLDFDGLVTECASLDALRQRFGRLNRMGRPITARAVILIRGDQAAKSDDDPVYGSALADTWAWLNQQKNDNEEIDFGIAHLGLQLPDDNTLDALNAPAKDAPVMLPAHVDCWTQTSPQPEPSPDVGLFLHGPRQGVGDVQVCWRADIELKEGDKESESYALESLTLCPPSSVECLPVPIRVLKGWLAGSDAEDQSSDVEGVSSDETEAEQINEAEAARRVIRWHGRETSLKDITGKPSEIQPGDVIVIPASLQGWQDLGTLPDEQALSPSLVDVGDRAHLLSRAKALLRIHRCFVDTWPDGVARNLALQLLQRIAEGAEEEFEEVATMREILVALKDLDESFAPSLGWLRESAAKLLKEPKPFFRRAVRRLGNKAVFVVGQSRFGTRSLDEASDADLFSDEDDTSSSGIARPNGKPVKLFDHLSGVATMAQRFAKGCGLPIPLVNALATAGRLHDLGKADPRFQALLRGGNRWVAGEILAKSGDMPKSWQAAREAKIRVGYPEKARHELLSLRMAESAPTLLPQDCELSDLVLHLIASHHGYCRPFAPVVFDEAPPEIDLDFDGHRFKWTGPTETERLDSGVPDRFWRLTRRYGWWGLAWLESLLRLADHRRSEWEETHDEAE